MKVAHILPTMFIGGVETGISRFVEESENVLDYRVFYVKQRGKIDVNQQHVFNLFLCILSKKWTPDVVVTSLWYAHPFGWILSKMGIRWYAFFHLAAFSNKLDSIISKFAWRNSLVRLCDSSATHQFLGQFYNLTSCVVPYVFKNDIELSSFADWEKRYYDFIWVGRNHPQKRLDILIKFLENLNSKFENPKVLILLSADESKTLKAFAESASFEIEIRRNLKNNEVLNLLRQSKFYVSTSDIEGMSLSTIEAVQSGCVPVVRPVGEIRNYLDDSSCVRINKIDDEYLNEIVQIVLFLSKNEQEVTRIRKKSSESVNSLPKYTYEFIKAINSR